jgi:hypothetical protein
MSSRLLLSLPFAFFLGVAASAQLPQPGRPASARHPRLALDDVPTYVLPRPDVERLMVEDEARSNWPGRYGAVIPAGFSSDDAGRWDDAPAGELVWRMRIVSPGARSLGLVLDRYELPASGKLFVHGRPGTVLGAFTSAVRQPNGMLAVQPVLGDELVLEYVQDAGDAGPELRIGEVTHDYRGILDALSFDTPVALLGGGGCLVDINCPIGAPYRDIKRAVMFVLFSGSYCSAGLLNNTAGDGTPYFLTANHCGNMTNVVAVFGYERTGCDTGASSQANTVAGATLLAASSRYDSQLYRLSAAPPASFQPYYAGWDRGITQTAPAVGISHPNGAPKKLSRDNDTPLTNTTRFQVTWELGKLLPGSSGSPLFNGSKRVIGPACCVNDFGCSQWANYGRFDKFWTQKSIGRWLDPLGTNLQGIDGLDPFQGQAIVYDGSGVNPTIYSSTTPPTVGTTWNARINATGYPGATTAWITGYQAPFSGSFLPWGELLVDTRTTRVFASTAPVVAGIALHSNPLPNLPALIGRVVFTQGVVLGSAPIVLTNGVELRMR